MPTSKKQIKTNRANAQLSTGPQTPGGKAVVSRNAIKHGLFARDLLLRSPHHTESRTEFKQLLDSLWEELQPETLFQEHLVRKIANCLWRSRRAVVAETAHINHELAEVDRHVLHDARIRRLYSDRGDTELTTADVKASTRYHVGRSLVPERNYSHNILWYEMRLDRQISRSYFMLTLLKHKPDKADDQLHQELLPEMRNDFHQDVRAGLPSEMRPEIRPELAIFENQ